MSSFRKPYQVRRRAPGQYQGGRWQEGEETSFAILASVQPLKPDELEALPEGRRAGSALKVYTSTALNTAREVREDAPGLSPDVLEYNGCWYEIVAVSPYQVGVLPHYKYYAAEVPE